MNMRIRILTFLVACAALALVAAGCGDKAAEKSPSETVTAALQKTAAIKSGTADIEGSLATGSLPGSISVTGESKFDTAAEGGGAMEIALALSIAGQEQKFGFVTVDGKNYLTVGDKALEQKGSSSQQVEPGQISSFIDGLGKYVSDVKSAGEVNGLQSYTATVDVKKMIAENKGSSGATGDLSKLSIPGIGSGSELSDSVSTADITVGVNSDGYAQELRIDMPLTIGGNTGGVRANIKLADINGAVTIEKPENVVSSSADLGALGSFLGGGN